MEGARASRVGIRWQRQRAARHALNSVRGNHTISAPAGETVPRDDAVSERPRQSFPVGPDTGPFGAPKVTYLECRERIARMDQMLNTAASETDAVARRVALRTILQLNPAADLIVHARATGDEALVAPIVRDLSDVQPLLIWGLVGETLAGPQPAEVIVEARNRLSSHLNVLGSLAAAEGIPHAGEGPSDCSHSPDFRSVRWFGKGYSFTGLQAAAVGVLWESWAKDAPEVGDAFLLAEANSESKRLADIFKGHPAWNTIIAQGGTKGTRRLVAPS